MCKLASFTSSRNAELQFGYVELELHGIASHVVVSLKEKVDHLKMFS